MIITTSESPQYRTRFSDGTHDGMADTTAEKGGSDAGFRHTISLNLHWRHA